MDCRMPNSKQGKFEVTGRPGQTSFICLHVAQVKLAGIAAAANAHEDESDALKQVDNDLDGPADDPTNPDVKDETEIAMPAATLPEPAGMAEVVVPEVQDDGEPH